eukprot:Protomagalhaensia_wolfi_Nauph_80__5376@NODE_585_length_2248_cov_294_478950_g438_i0_p1_GENE_NODE_585_length_2248_cov_294_478950_g438_i0NODE_585_length_2248_cov_294_478950_g438_i0_p1_ORF_typecomplete_len221_score34_09LSM/PF01423_22/3_9e10CAAX_1/PF15895_5/0_033GcnA_N/PF18229_1/0_17SSP160/PF06933_11/0_4_NODE_585_length_2248_cov_294_478950_g438_i04021064
MRPNIAGIQGSWVQSLEEDSQQVVLVMLRDNKTFVGILKTFDHFGNLLLDKCCERLACPQRPQDFAELYLGCLLVRGENIMLFGVLADLDPAEHLRRLAAMDTRGLRGSEPLAPIRCGVRVCQVPLAQVLLEIEASRKEEETAEQTWHNYRALLQTATALSSGDDAVERCFVNELLTRLSTAQTDHEVNLARSVFHRYVRAAASALALLQERRSNCLEAD